MKQRGYEHKIVTHKDSKITHSIKKNEETESENQIEGNLRRSGRNVERADYKLIGNGRRIIINTGGSEVAKHMQAYEHKNEDIEYSILQTEGNWLKRGIKEAIEIRRKSPTLNADEGRYYLSKIWTKTVRKSDVIQMHVTSNENIAMDIAVNSAQ